MLDRLASWLAGLGLGAWTWFERRPGWIQGLLVLAAVALVVALTHCDELRRAHDWAEFRAWQERRKAARLRGMR